MGGALLSTNAFAQSLLVESFVDPDLSLMTNPGAGVFVVSDSGTGDTFSVRDILILENGSTGSSLVGSADSFSFTSGDDSSGVLFFYSGGGPFDFGGGGTFTAIGVTFSAAPGAPGNAEGFLGLELGIRLQRQSSRA